MKKKRHNSLSACAALTFGLFLASAEANRANRPGWRSFHRLIALLDSPVSAATSSVVCSWNR